MGRAAAARTAPLDKPRATDGALLASRSMTHRADLLALAARVEAATGACRFMDADIMSLLTDTVERDDGDWWYGPHDEPPRRVPAFTASRDAAATLTLPRWSRTIVSMPGYVDGVLVGDAIVDLHHDTSSGGGPYVRGAASGDHAEARARTAATLRAMAEEAGDE